MIDTIRHPGIVESTEGNKLRIRITQTSGCAACRAKGYCTSADACEMRMEISVTDVSTYHPGDAVWVVGRRSAGRQAVCWAFIFPLLVMLLSLWICIALGLSEAASAGLSLALLIPYYMALRLCHRRLAGRFVFSVTR